MYLGRYSVGDSLDLALPSRTPSGALVTPDFVPDCRIYSGSTFTSAVSLYSNQIDRNSFIANYIIPASLGSTTIKKYSILYTWIVGGDTYNAADTFEVVPTDTSYGPVIGLFGVNMSGGQWVITQTDYQGLSLGFNPSDN